MPYVYLGGPVDSVPQGEFSDELAWRAKAAQKVHGGTGWDVFDPMAAWTGGADPATVGVQRVNDVAVSYCSIFFARYHPESFGTQMEAGTAIANGRMVILWGNGIEKKKSAALQGIRTKATFDEAIDYLCDLIRSLSDRPHTTTQETPDTISPAEKTPPSPQGSS